MLPIVLKKCISISKIRGSVEWSSQLIQLHNGLIVFWKLYLNLRSLKWLKPSLSLVINLSPLGLWQIKTEFAYGRMNLRILVFKTNKLSASRSPGFNFFHLMIVDRKNKFFKKLWSEGQCLVRLLFSTTYVWQELN